eukprot:SAG22_NODE_6054_length_909_cov_1.014815_2_plen_157_part_01
MVGGLSDTFGRVPVLSIGRVGGVLYLLLLPRTTTLAGRRLVDTLFMFPTGLMLAGSQSVLDAAQADLFGKRPQLSARINAQNGLCWTVSHVSALAIGAALAKRFGLAAQWRFSLAAAVLNLGLTARLVAETLPISRRRAFTFKRSNPLGNLLLLFNR